MNRAKVIILGCGQIGTAVHTLISRKNRTRATATILAHTLAEGPSIFNGVDVEVWDSRLTPISSMAINFSTGSTNNIATALRAAGATHVINALPSSLNEKVALAAVWAGCHYIDFTEDDLMAEAVRRLYAGTRLTCASQCGLAPGFINYVGHRLASKIEHPEKLMICTGALPKNVSYSDHCSSLTAVDNYALSYSVDGLVTRYTQPCKVRTRGVEQNVTPLLGLEYVLLNGVKYEAAFTSGGVGSLIADLAHIPTVYYKTLRYPGHYAYVLDAVNRHDGDHESIKKEFLEVFPFCTDDIIVVYGECVGKSSSSQLRRETFAAKFSGTQGLSAVQSTTAGAGVAVLELMLKNRLSGTVSHADVPLSEFMNTETYSQTYLISH